VDGFVLPPGLLRAPDQTPAFAAWLAGLAGLDAGRVRLWLFARCVQESVEDPNLQAVAARLAP
jgi:hypothetical protein